MGNGLLIFPVPSPQRCTELVEVSPVPSHQSPNNSPRITVIACPAKKTRFSPG
ncbi:MAG: hypothetical protein ACKPB7_15020 [Sphaerospermopsis kisseleviana]